ncbi:MAG: hypothetical protein EBY30_12915, partial [Rhodospirillales bacterium]|nr:hypothetical protein [Rhodospirillales bacterium]
MKRACGKIPAPSARIFLGNSLAAILIRGEDTIQAQRERRVMIAEMQPLSQRYDLPLTAAPGPAPRFESWCSIQFWQKLCMVTPFTVTGGPALSACIGCSEAWLPLA